MKSIFYVLLLGVVSCAKPSLVKNNDLEKENLKGKVKSTYTEERFVKKKNGKPYFHGKIINKRIQCFNEYGLNTYTCDSEPGDKSESRSEYKFDNQNRIKKQIDAERQEKTGYVKGAHQQPSAGLSTFTVDNQRGGGDAIARIYLNGAKPAARSIYVKAGEKFTARALPPGNYVFRYRFVGSTKTYEADRLFPLEEITTVDGTRYSNVTVTLFKVSDGNLQTSEVSDDKF